MQTLKKKNKNNLIITYSLFNFLFCPLIIMQFYSKHFPISNNIQKLFYLLLKSNAPFLDLDKGNLTIYLCITFQIDFTKLLHI